MGRADDFLSPTDASGGGCHSGSSSRRSSASSAGGNREASGKGTNILSRAFSKLGRKDKDKDKDKNKNQDLNQDLKANNPFLDDSEGVPPAYTDTISGPSTEYPPEKTAAYSSGQNTSYPPGVPASPSGQDASSSSAQNVTTPSKTSFGSLFRKNTALSDAPPDDSAFNLLSTVDTIFVLDDSPSMEDDRRWEQLGEAIEAIVPVCVKHDEDGIDVFFLNQKSDEPADASRGSPGTGFTGIASVEQVKALFKDVHPNGWTPTGTRLLKIIEAHSQRYELYRMYTDALKQRPQPQPLPEPISAPKPLNIIVITDGMANDDIRTKIVEAATMLRNVGAPTDQVGIQFFQIGTDPGASEQLAELDDKLTQFGIHDMVDTTPYKPGRSGRLSTNQLLKAVAGGIHRGYDDKKPEQMY